MKSMWTAAAGMSAQQTVLDVIGNNVANINTPGFKQACVALSDLAYEEERPAAQNLPALSVGAGARAASTLSVFTQGALTETGVQTDLALNGEGLFVLSAPGGRLYTRAGNFRVAPDGYLTTPEGYRLEGVSAVPQDYVGLSVARDGRVYAVMPDNSQRDLGRIRLARFVSPSGLEAAGGNVYRESAASGPPTFVDPGEGCSILQGFLERSNVDVANELVSVIAAQRAYDLCAKIVQTQDEMLSTANSMKR